MFITSLHKIIGKTCVHVKVDSHFIDKIIIAHCV